MAASPEAQSEAISKLSSQFDTPEYATPVGSPEVSYYCAGNPTTSLEQFFKHAHEGEIGGSSSGSGETSTESENGG
ncbi:MAG: hypothetical protein WB507_06115 [Solirubrobacterales bacterium]